MNNGYEADKDRKHEDIDFEEYLADSAEPTGKPRQEKPVTQRSVRRLASALSQEARPNSPSSERRDSDVATDDVVRSEVKNDENLQGESRGRLVKRMAWSTKQRLIVAFQGEAGAYSEQALRDYFGSEAVSLPCADFRGIFDAIHSGKAQRGILPVENSLAGTVSAAYDQLADHDLRIQGEVILRVEHCLMAPAGLKLQDIKRVKSHPQALAQCQQTLRRLGLEAVVHYDTAGAARDLAAHPEPGTAAIASALAARTYGLQILSHHFEDETLNYTRFFILGLSDPPRKDPSKTSVIFTTRHQPGALHRVLSELADRDINLTKIESRPRRNRPWHYLFYVDFEGHEDQPEIREALLGILKQASFLKVLGSYPAAPLPLIDSSLDRRD
ncbi:MAG: prephenate dehydratase [Candidatus Promineifilaceae bacterium]|jgi:prephenate dehydratase